MVSKIPEFMRSPQQSDPIRLASGSYVGSAGGKETTRKIMETPPIVVAVEIEMIKFERYLGGD